MSPLQLIETWLRLRLPEPTMQWLQVQAGKVAKDSGDAGLYTAVSMVTRRVGKEDLQASADELRAAAASRPGWDPTDWSVDQAARIYLLLASGDEGERFSRRLDQLCVTGDIGELVAFYRGLPLYPDQPRYAARAAEGVRSNMKAVFQAVAHRNPYPAEQLPEGAWNQMVLKALFVGIPLDPIIGLDQRVNAALARMLRDYAHERWAAARTVSPELWRCVGPFAIDDALDDLTRVLASSSEHERAAAALALGQSPAPGAATLLNAHPVLAKAINEGTLTWRSLALAG
ncbi:MAG: EboA domain-containing protein [Burkholderiales bacterium]|nr:EboA domain-containing protein [Burkholderiales bacterium]